MLQSGKITNELKKMPFHLNNFMHYDELFSPHKFSEWYFFKTIK